jgi:hypothetical protein
MKIVCTILVGKRKRPFVVRTSSVFRGGGGGGTEKNIVSRLKKRTLRAIMETKETGGGLAVRG